MIAWIGTVASIAGSFIVAMQLYLVGYLLFITGSISWLIVAYRSKDRALITLNSAFLLANLIGVYNAF